MEIIPARLSTSDQMFVCVQGIRKPRPSHQLVAQNVHTFNPGNLGKVNVYHIPYDENRECMAFGFEVENKSLVFPVVTHGEKLEFEVLPTDKPITAGSFDEKFLFCWGENNISGYWKSLESVAKPKTYLCVKGRGKVTTTKERVPGFRISYTDEKKDKDLRSSGSDKTLENKTNKYKMISFQRRNLKRGSSCCEGSVAPNKPLRCRETKRIKMSVKS